MLNYGCMILSKGRDTRCDKSLRRVAATGCCNKSPRMTCENHCRCDRILSLRSVAQIQTGLNLCDISQRQTKRKRLVAAAVQTRRLVAATCRPDLSHRVSRPCSLVWHFSDKLEKLKERALRSVFEIRKTIIDTIIDIVTGSKILLY